jgi:phosphopantetheine--protein transferase-like protein
MIIGIGMDLVDMRRTTRLLESHGRTALIRVMNKHSIHFYRHNIQLGFAKIWAYKEAVIKAASGLIYMSDIEISHDIAGAPVACINQSQKFLRLILQKRCPNFMHDDKTMHVSITSTDEYPYVSAMCILELL